MALEVMEGGQSNAGAAGSKAGHEATPNWEGAEAWEEGYKILQRALPAQSHNRGEDEARGPPKRLRALNTCGRHRGKDGGDPPPSGARTRRAVGARGGPPNIAARYPTTRSGPGRRSPPPAPTARGTRAQAGGGGGQAVRIHRAQLEAGGRGGPPPNVSMRPQCTARHQGRGRTPQTRRRRREEPPEQRALPAHGMQGGGGGEHGGGNRGTPRSALSTARLRATSTI